MWLCDVCTPGRHRAILRKSIASNAKSSCATQASANPTTLDPGSCSSVAPLTQPKLLVKHVHTRRPRRAARRAPFLSSSPSPIVGGYRLGPLVRAARRHTHGAPCTVALRAAQARHSLPGDRRCPRWAWLSRVVRGVLGLPAALRECRVRR